MAPIMNNLQEEIEKLSPSERSLFEVLLARSGLDMSGLVLSLSGKQDDPPPLSFAQQRLWVLDQLEPNSSVYNIVSAIRIRGPLQAATLEKSLNRVVERQAVLRTTFNTIGYSPAQIIKPYIKIALTTIDLSEMLQKDREEVAISFAARETERPFNLGTGPLLRTFLIGLGEQEHIFILSIHHIISDGWSMGLMLKEVATFYDAYINCKQPSLPSLPIQYADFARWQNRWFSGERVSVHLSYWKRQLEGNIQELNLPIDYPGKSGKGLRGASQTITIAKELADRAVALSQREGVTLFMTLVAAFKALLYGYSGQADMIIGTGIANRTRRETENLIGFFVNLLVLRTNMAGDPKFTELIKRVSETVLGAFAHQDLSFERLVNELRIERQEHSTPLIDAVIVLQNAPNEAPTLPGLNVELLDIESQTTRFHLTLFLTNTGNGLKATMQYNTGLFKDSTITQMLRRFESLLSYSVAHPQERLNKLNIHAETDVRQRLMDSRKQKTSGFSELMSIKPKVVSLAKEKLVETGSLQAGETLPLVIRPAVHGVDLIEWGRANREFIEERLLQNGAILFRGFNIESVDQFEQFASNTCSELFEENGELPRTNISGRVYTPVQYSPDRPILWHSENTFCPRWPLKIYFFCIQPARSGGETPIVDSRKVFSMVRPDIRERFTRKNIMYVRNYDGTLGLSWQTVFQTENKNDVESYCRKNGIEFEWRGENWLRTRAVCPAVVKHPKTGEMVWFNQATHWHPYCLSDDMVGSLASVFDEESLPRNVFYGDGAPIAGSEMESICNVYKQAEVCFPWQKGDVLMLDNMLTSHARNPYVEPRQIAVAMGDLIGKDSLPPLG